MAIQVDHESASRIHVKGYTGDKENVVFEWDSIESPGELILNKYEDGKYVFSSAGVLTPDDRVWQ